MANCIAISSTEHLPLENTLLVHYSISCSGTWDILQTSTAYRNVCDDFWVVMYPNIQHPRHSDFPISVGGNSSESCTFAWNYGGIQGISAEDFDPSHSYLTQLGIFNTLCGQTGHTGQTGTTGGGGGSTTGQTGTTGAYNLEPIQGNTRPPYRGGPDPPIPGGPLPPLPPIPYFTQFPGGPAAPFVGQIGPGWSPFPGIQQPPPPGDGSSSSAIGTVGVNYNTQILNQPSSTSVVQTTPGTFVGISQAGTVGVAPGGPTFIPGGTVGTVPGGGTTLFIPGSTVGIAPNGPTYIPGSTVGILPNTNVSVINTNVVGIPWTTSVSSITPVSTSVTNISNSITPQLTPLVVTRESDATVGQQFLPNSNQTPGGRSRAISTLPGLSIPSNELRSEVDTSRNSDANFSDTEGYLSKYNFDLININDQSNSISLNYLNTSSVIPTSKTLLEIPNDDIPAGERLFISTAFILPAGIEIPSTISLWVIDSQNRTILLARNSSTTDSTSPLTLVYSSNTYQAPPGANTVISIVTDSQEKIIGIASRKFVIRPILINRATNSDDRLRGQTNRTSHSSLPTTIVDLVNVTKDPVTIYSDGKTLHNLILNKVTNSDNFISVVAVVGPKVSSRYSITLYDLIKITLPTSPTTWKNVIGPVPVLGELASDRNRVIAYSEDKIRLNNEDLYPDSHTVGINRVDTTASQIMLSIGPSDQEVPGNKMMKIYLSDSYQLRPYYVRIISAIAENLEDGNAVTYTHTIFGNTPLASTKLAILNHRFRKDYISETYLDDISYVTTDTKGDFVITIYSLLYGHYFSVIEPRHDGYNPYKNVVYTSKI